MCNCFKELEIKAIKQAKFDYPNSELRNVEIERTHGKIDKTMGYVGMNYVFLSKKGVYRRYSVNIDRDWKYCPICGVKL